LQKESRGRRTSILVESTVELVNGRRNLEALLEDSLLALKADILRPTNESSQIPLGGQRLAHTELAGGALEKIRFGGLLGNNLLLSSFTGSGLYIEQHIC